jgi:glycosyltransferase involved in cell wall biosynthesis
MKAKAFIFTAEEDFGIIVVEAMACGTPVIAFRKGGASETVVHNKTGILFDQQTEESLN